MGLPRFAICHFSDTTNCTYIHVSEMGQFAAEMALKDAGLDYGVVEAVAASYCYGDPTSGQCES